MSADVTCYTTDCVLNKGEVCQAEEIEISDTQECLTYEEGEDEEDDDDPSADSADIPFKGRENFQ